MELGNRKQMSGSEEFISGVTQIAYINVIVWTFTFCLGGVLFKESPFSVCMAARVTQQLLLRLASVFLQTNDSN